MGHNAVLGEWRSIMMAYGAQSVMITGIYQMQMLFANSWDVDMPSRHLSLLIMVKDQDRSGWMMWTAPGLNLVSGHVPPGHGVSTTANTRRMLESCAQVCSETLFFFRLWVGREGIWRGKPRLGSLSWTAYYSVLTASMAGQHILYPIKIQRVYWSPYFSLTDTHTKVYGGVLW